MLAAEVAVLAVLLAVLIAVLLTVLTVELTALTTSPDDAAVPAEIVLFPDDVVVLADVVAPDEEAVVLVFVVVLVPPTFTELFVDIGNCPMILLPSNPKALFASIPNEDSKRNAKIPVSIPFLLLIFLIKFLFKVFLSCLLAICNLYIRSPKFF